MPLPRRKTNFLRKNAFLPPLAPLPLPPSLRCSKYLILTVLRKIPAAGCGAAPLPCRPVPLIQIFQYHRRLQPCPLINSPSSLSITACSARRENPASNTAIRTRSACTSRCAPPAPGQGTYYLRYKDDTGKTCHQKISRTTDTTLAEACRRAKTLKAEIALGRNPGAEGQPKQSELTYERLFEDHYVPHKHLHKRSIADDIRIFRSKSCRLDAQCGLAIGYPR